MLHKKVRYYVKKFAMIQWSKKERRKDKNYNYYSDCNEYSVLYNTTQFLAMKIVK